LVSVIAFHVPINYGNGGQQEKSTPPVDAAGGNILALDNLDVDCGPGAAISQFRLVRDGDQVFLPLSHLA
jgi:hypothetical protein